MTAASAGPVGAAASRRFVSSGEDDGRETRRLEERSRVRERRQRLGEHAVLQRVAEVRGEWIAGRANRCGERVGVDHVGVENRAVRKRLRDELRADGERRDAETALGVGLDVDPDPLRRRRAARVYEGLQRLGERGFAVHGRGGVARLEQARGVEEERLGRTRRSVREREPRVGRVAAECHAREARGGERAVLEPDREPCVHEGLRPVEHGRRPVARRRADGGLVRGLLPVEPEELDHLRRRQRRVLAVAAALLEPALLEPDFLELHRAHLARRVELDDHDAVAVSQRSRRRLHVERLEGRLELRRRRIEEQRPGRRQRTEVEDEGEPEAGPRLGDGRRQVVRAEDRAAARRPRP